MSDKSTEQSERFEETARELGVDLNEEKLKETLRRIAPDAKPAPKEQR